MPRFRSVAVIGGMRSVHSVRAVFTALTAVPGIDRCEVTLGRAIIEHDGPLTEELLRTALALVDCTLEGYTAERTRELPLA